MKNSVYININNRIKGVLNMLGKKGLIAIILVITLVSLIGCIDTDTQDRTGNNSDKEDIEEREEKIITQLRELNETDADLSKITEFIDENIHKVSKEKASSMISILDEAHNNHSQSFEEKFFHSDIQKAFIDAFNSGTGLEELGDIDDEKLNELLAETKNKGYKIETAEGLFFPIIDYKLYKKYNYYVTKDMGTYIDIMSVESAEIPAKDAALVISWDELIARAVRQEDFITKYPNSVKVDKVKKLFSNYVNYIFYGLDNTPLFSYENNSINDNAKKDYLENIKSESDSKLIETIADFIDVLEQNNYKLTEDVYNFRENAVENLLNK